ncbi:hypothetical protein LPJ53_002431 [Coemansia erecta]|uniref:Transforming acidic coiled-coil-containing protein C-terminal domain-containing protein n=1 Tax=Coemansia erecta TaxID=147472 RepID=A0A9W8CRV5_9FUNG|nr:hypothetical protein LPJ53_002431 [Coemansia erecta]
MSDDFTKTPNSKNSGHDSFLSLQSPPPPIAFSPGSHSRETFETTGGGGMKRSRADIATPQKAGTMEAARQERMEFINTPARAPSATKRIMVGRSESPTRLDESAQMMRLVETETETLSIHSVDSPPAFKFALGGEPLPRWKEMQGSLGSGAAAAAATAASMDWDDGDGAGARTVVLDAAADEPEDCFFEADNGLLSSAADDTVVINSVYSARDNSVGNRAGIVTPAGFGVEDKQARNETTTTTTQTQTQTSSAPVGDSDDNDSEFEFNIAQPQNSKTPQSATSTTNASASKSLSPQPVPQHSTSRTMSPVVTQAAEPAFTQLPGRSLASSAIHGNDDQDIDMMATDSPTRDARENTEHSASARTPVRYEGGSTMDLLSAGPIARTKPELPSAKILADPALVNAACVPLPGTPSMDVNQVTPQKSPGKKAANEPDIFIPTDWLMSPERKNTSGGSAMATPLKRVSSPGTGADGNLVSVTPVNQRLLDSLEIQWVSPRRVPKFSEVDMDEVKSGYEDQLTKRDQLHRMIMDSVKEEFAAQMREVEKNAEIERRRAHEEHARQIEQLRRGYDETLKAERARFMEDIARRDEDTRIQANELSREIEAGHAERALIIEEREKLKVELEELLTKYIENEDRLNARIQGLERAISDSTLQRQDVEKQLTETLTAAEELGAERDEALQRIEDLTSENIRLDELSSNLRSDILVAEERSAKIREYAEGTLAGANAEITTMREQLAGANHEIHILKAQNSKAEARARSLQIQFDGTKRQNEELLALCDRISFMGAAGSVDAAGNSFLRVDQGTRVHGQNIANLNENSVTGQQGGPAVEANGAVVVVAN